jgi:hypothetical protein
MGPFGGAQDARVSTNVGGARGGSTAGAAAKAATPGFACGSGAAIAVRADTKVATSETAPKTGLLGGGPLGGVSSRGARGCAAPI